MVEAERLARHRCCLRRGSAWRPGGGLLRASRHPRGGRASPCVRSCSLPLRMTATSTALPTAVVGHRSRGRSCENPSRPCRRSWTTTSPASMPAGLAGPFSSTPATSAPARAALEVEELAVGRPRRRCWIRTPSQPRRGLAELAEAGRPRGTRPWTPAPQSRGPPSRRSATGSAVLTPTTSPFEVEQRTAGITAC